MIKFTDKTIMNKQELNFYDSLDYEKYLKGMKVVKLDDSNIIQTSKSILIKITKS